MSSLRPLFLLSTVLAPLAAVFCACTINSATEETPDGGPSTGVDSAVPGTDAGGSASALGFHPSNLGSLLESVDLAKLIDMDVSGTSNELNANCASRPDDGCVVLSVTQVDGSKADVYVAKSWKIEPNGLLPVKSKQPVIIVATGTISILGRLDASATGQFTVGGGAQPAAAGPGAGGAGVNGNATSTGIGGGGASFCGLGGAGGAASGTNGAAGKPYGNATLIPLLGGSAGGAGGLAAGAGGGAIQLVAGVSIDVGATGVVSVGGGGGDNGGGNYGACGAGSGGALLLEAPVVTIEGILAANGGAGGAGDTPGTTGIDGTPTGTAVLGAHPGTTGAGGAGSGGQTNNGGAGGPGDALGGTYVPSAGGGGSGWIRINTKSGAATLSGTLSPAVGTACLGQGTVQ